MTINSLNDLTQLINRHIKSQECLGDILTKANVLLDVAIDCELLSYPAEIVYPYFSAVSDFVRQATKL